MNEITLLGENSDSFSLIKYPDGQKTICLRMGLLNKKVPVKINARIKNFSELEVLGCLIAALKANDFVITDLNFVYLFGIRSDRAFEVGQPNYLRDVLLPIIKSYKITTTLSWPFLPLALMNDDIYLDDKFFNGMVRIEEKCIFIAGDSTALNCHSNGTDFYFEKERDSFGNIKIEMTPELIRKIKSDRNRDILIYDDLCDGGATFIGEAKLIKEIAPMKKLKLAVMHGLFTKGIEPLLKYYDEIICTNSYQDIDHPKVKQIKVI